VLNDSWCLPYSAIEGCEQSRQNKVAVRSELGEPRPHYPRARFCSVLVLFFVVHGKTRTRLAAYGTSIRVPSSLCQAKSFPCCMSPASTYTSTHKHPFHFIIKRTPSIQCQCNNNSPPRAPLCIRAVLGCSLSPSPEITGILGLARTSNLYPCTALDRKTQARARHTRREKTKKERKEKDPPHPPLMSLFARGARVRQPA
jgi:hypothetical protein